VRSDRRLIFEQRPFPFTVTKEEGCRLKYGGLESIRANLKNTGCHLQYGGLEREREADLDGKGR